MNPHTILRMGLVGLVFVTIIAGCSPAPTPSPTLVPTIDPQPTFDAIATNAVQTMAADLTRNAPTATPVIPTDTPVPPTETPALPTNTPAPTETPTRVFIPWTATPTPTQPAYACTVTNVSPSSSTTIKVDQDFDAEWSLKNAGTQTWVAGNTDIRFIEGTKLQTAGDIFDLQSNVAPNGTYKVTIDMKAPGSDGTYSASWGIYLEDGSVCTLNLKISVTK